jgi:hypothetical protein
VLAGVTLKLHRHELALSEYSHVRFGFEPRELRAMLEAAGLAVDACDVTSREKRPPHFEVITVHARRRDGAPAHAPGQDAANAVPRRMLNGTANVEPRPGKKPRRRPTP